MLYGFKVFYPIFDVKLRTIMEVLRLPQGEQFVAGSGNLKRVYQRLVKIYDPLLFFCRKGEGRVSIDLKEYEVIENTLIFLMPGSIVSCSYRSEDLEFSFAICSDELFQEAAFRFEYAFFEYIKNNPCMQFFENDISGFYGLIRATNSIYDDKEHVFRVPIFKNILQCFLMEIYDKSFQRFSNVPLKSSNRKEALFKHFLQLVHEHYIDEREVAFYADKLCITSRYLSAVVNSVSRHTPKEFIDRFVILEIKALLQSTDLSMQEIANQLHFPDQSFFGRYFKKHTGVMPSRYRLENK